jgi:hypothetical protein
MTGKTGHWTIVPDSTADWEVKTITGLVDSVKVLTDTVQTLSAEVAALKGAQQPQVSGTFTLSGQGTVAPS